MSAQQIVFKIIGWLLLFLFAVGFFRFLFNQWAVKEQARRESGPFSKPTTFQNNKSKENVSH
jgi:hypothetical protein